MEFALPWFCYQVMIVASLVSTPVKVRRFEMKTRKITGYFLMFLLSFIMLSGSVPASDPEEYPVIYSNFNTGGTLDGPTGAATFMPDVDILLKSVTTYHWNGSRGSDPGYISIYTSGGGHTGTWQASARSGYLDAPNVYWDVFPNVVLKAGTLYYIEDSDTATWSCNAESDYIGFFELRGIPSEEDVRETSVIQQEPLPENTAENTETEGFPGREETAVTESIASDKPADTARTGGILQTDGIFLQFERDTAGFTLEKDSPADGKDVLADCFRLNFGSENSEPEPLPARVGLKLTKPLPEGAAACLAIGIPYETDDGSEGLLWDYVTAEVIDGTAYADIDFSYYGSFPESTHFSETPGNPGIRKSKGKTCLLSLLAVEHIKSAQGHFVLRLRRVYIQEYTGNKDGLTFSDCSRILDDLESIWQHYVSLGYKNVRNLTEHPMEITLAPIPEDGAYYAYPASLDKGYMQLKYSELLGMYGYRSSERKYTKSGIKAAASLNEDLYRTMAHEMFHYFQNQYINSAVFRLPSSNDWFHEGSAMYYEDVLAKASGLDQEGSALYVEQRMDIYSGIISMKDYSAGGYARRPFFQYLEECIGSGTIKKAYEAYEKSGLTITLTPSFSDLLPAASGKTLEQLAEGFYQTLVTTKLLNARSNKPWDIYDTADKDFHNNKRNYPERAYLDTLEINGDDSYFSDCRWNKTITVYPYGASFIKLDARKLPGMVTGLIISAMNPDIKLTVMTFTGNDYSSLQVYAGRDSAEVPASSGKILVMLTDTSGSQNSASISVVPAFAGGTHPTGKEKNLPGEFDGSLTYLNDKDEMVTVPAKGVVILSESEGIVSISTYDKSYGFTISGAYRPSNGVVYGSDGSACISGATEFAQDEYGSPFSAQILGIDLLAYRYGSDGKIIAAFRGYGGGISEEEQVYVDF